MCHTKTPPIQGGALRVLPGPLAVPHGDPGAGAKAKSKARREFRSVRRGSWDPLGPAVPVGQTPQGRRTRMCAVFGGRTAGVCFFCLLFFAQAKKSRAPAASGTMPNRPPCLSKPTNATDVRIALTANAPAPREVPVAGLRCPSPQPLSPTGTSFGRRRERGFKTQALFCGRIWHTAWHITSTRPASSRTSPARNNCVRVRSTKRA